MEQFFFEYNTNSISHFAVICFMKNFFVRQLPDVMPCDILMCGEKKLSVLYVTKSN